MPEVLILDDEAELRSLLVRGLAKLEGIDVVDVGTVAEAVNMLRTAPPSLIISDLDLPDGSGLQLLGEIDRANLRVPVIFVSAYLDELSEWIPRRADVEVRPKPIELEALRRLVRERLAMAKEGGKQPFTVDDYVALACMGRQALLIKLENSDRLVGQIFIRSGQVWSAIDTVGRGEAALERLRAADGTVALEPMRVEVARNIPSELGGFTPPLSMPSMEEPRSLADMVTAPLVLETPGSKPIEIADAPEKQPLVEIAVPDVEPGDMEKLERGAAPLEEVPISEDLPKSVDLPRDDEPPLVFPSVDTETFAMATLDDETFALDSFDPDDPHATSSVGPPPRPAETVDLVKFQTGEAQPIVLPVAQFEIPMEEPEESQDLTDLPVVVVEETETETSTETKTEAKTKAKADTIEELPAILELAIEAVLDRDYPAALEAYARAEAIVPDDPIVRGNLKRLRALAAKS